MSVKYLMLSASVMSILTSNIVSSGISKISSLYDQLSEHTEKYALKSYHDEIRDMDIHTKMDYTKLILKKYKDSKDEDIIFIVDKLTESIESLQTKLTIITRKIVFHKSKYLHKYRTLDLSYDLRSLKHDVDILNQRLKLLKVSNMTSKNF